MFAFPFLVHQCVPISFSHSCQPLRSYEKLRAHSDCLQDCWDGQHWPSAQFIALHVKISPVGTLNATPSLPLLGLAGKVLAGGVTSFAHLGQKPAEMPEGTRTQNICSSSHHW